MPRESKTYLRNRPALSIPAARSPFEPVSRPGSLGPRSESSAASPAKFSADRPTLPLFRFRFQAIPHVFPPPPRIPTAAPDAKSPTSSAFPQPALHSVRPACSKKRPELEGKQPLTSKRESKNEE